MAQIEREGTPVSWNIDQNLSWHTLWQSFTIPDLELLLAEDDMNLDKSLPFRFAYAHEVDLSPDNSGNWTNLHNGDRIWTLALECVDAFSIGITFRSINLPRGGKIYIYSEDHRDYIGPISYSDNRSTQLGTTQIEGSRIIIEYYEPYAYRGLGEFSVQYISHAYRDIGDSSAPLSSTCLNMLSESDHSGRNVSASVLRMFVDKGQRVATATLINNTTYNGMPYVMTATSALIGQPSSWVFQFNVTSSDCGLQPITCEALAICGAAIVKSDSQTGLSLLRLRSKPGNNWSAYYSGWKILDEVGTNQYRCIQHAFGLQQSVSTFSSTTEDSDLNGYSTYRLESPVTGGTFQGSSGSPLFDSDQNLVGIFIGGDSDCDGNGNDHFGMISNSWSSFRDYLDPRQIVSDKLEGTYPVLSSDESTNSWDVTFFPNPANDWIYIQTSDDSTLPEVHIWDAAGREVMIRKPQVPTLDLQELPKGIYAISFVLNEKVVTKSLLIR